LQQTGTPDKIRTAQPAKVRAKADRPAPDVAGVWQAFAAQNRSPVSVSWNARNGTPETIFGKVGTAVGKPSEKAARRFLADNSQLFKLSGGTADLELARSVESPIGTHVVFEQRYGGVRVYGAEAAVNFNRAGEIIAVGNTYEPEIKLDSVEPLIAGPDAASLVASVFSQGRSEKTSAELVIYPFGGGHRLAWQVRSVTDGPTWESFVDARSGELLEEPRDINRYVDGTGQVFVINAIVATRNNSLTDQNDAASAVPASAYSAVALRGLLGNGYLDGAYASSSKTKKRAFSPANSFVFDRSFDGFSETMGYYYIDYAERYIQSLGFSNINNRQQVFSVNRFKGDNSYYSPQSTEITLGIGGVDDAEDADVIVHEYGHSIQDNQVPGFGRTLEAGSMGEGFGDYWAGTIGAQLSGGFQDECLAEWDATSYSSSNPPCLRRLDGTKHYPEDVQGEVHADGEMWSAALWQIRAAIGAANADRTVLASHFLLTPDATFNNGADALVTAATNLGLANRHVNAIRNILRDRGFTVTL
jgi:Zn-dependent metalloprotease